MNEIILIENYIKCFRHFGDFTGRSNRIEFWTFVIVNTVISIPFIVLFFSGLWDYKECGNTTMLSIGATLMILWTLITSIPKISAAVRRLHDIGKSGYWLFILGIPALGSLIIIYFLLLKGDEEENKYGYPPVDDYE